MTMQQDLEAAVFGGGCFWCTEAVFLEMIGVVSVVSGYAGGHTENPTYEQVCSGGTGHAEVVKITFDTAVVSYRDLLDVFFATHDPTTLNRQGADRGTQYRSIIFYADEDQRAAAEETIRELDESGELQARWSPNWPPWTDSTRLRTTTRTSTRTIRITPTVRSSSAPSSASSAASSPYNCAKLVLNRRRPPYVAC